MKSIITVVPVLLAYGALCAQTTLITNIPGRKTVSLNGKWQYIVDPYETGYYNYRWQERREDDRNAYWNSDVPRNKTDLLEHGYTEKYTLNVPGDWNTQDPKFFYYEGTVWYKRSFNYPPPGAGKRIFLHFGAVNHEAHVYLNGKKLGSHTGGFTPFNFEVPDSLLRAENNFLAVKVDNKRKADEVPTLNTDWWNYGGITRDVSLVEVPRIFIEDYFIHLKNNTEDEVEGWVRLNGAARETVTLEIPELKWKRQLEANSDSLAFRFRIPGLKLWSPEAPKLYTVSLHTVTDRVEERIGFRTITAAGSKLLLNNRPLFLRGVCLHEEMPREGRRAHSPEDAAWLLGQVKELNANMVRLAHYPHNEHITRLADSLGILLWSEIPVYWTVSFSNPEVLRKAKIQLHDMIARDRNRASIIVWSVGNETPVHAARTDFMSRLALTARQLDSSRLISAALEVHSVNGVNVVDDPLGNYTDLISVNEYIGWYGGLPSGARNARWEIKYDKPLFISETGAEALGGFHGDSLTRWSEEYQEWYYREQVAMMKRMPPSFSGLSPWILNDFRSPRRNHPVYQEGWNNKGLYSHQGNKKKAFFVLKEYYDALAGESAPAARPEKRKKKRSL